MKNKILGFILSVCLVISATFALTACTKHTHELKASSTFVIEEGKAYEIYACECGKGETEKRELTNYTIATTETAHDLINTSNNTTIVLSAGTYSDETLWFNLSNTPTNDLTIVGVEGTEVSEIYASVHDGAKITNLTIMNIKFTGLGVRSNHTEIEGLNVVNCNFVGKMGVTIGDNKIKNLVVKDCDFNLSDEASATQTAVYINAGVENLIVENCKFENIPYNAIQANNDAGGVVNANITIKNNEFIKTGSRVIYLGGLTSTEGTTLVIEKNSFCMPTTAKTDGNYVKLGTEVEISKNNTWTIDKSKDIEYYLSGAKLPA